MTRVHRVFAFDGLRAIITLWIYDEVLASRRDLADTDPYSQHIYNPFMFLMLLTHLNLLQL